MKKTLLCIILMGFAKSWSQTTTENYTKTYEPKSAYSISQLDNLISDPSTDSSITLSNPVSTGTYKAKEQITLSNGFHATGNVTIKIVGYHPEVLENITYTDGLGRPTQIMAKGQSPDGYDIVQFMEYDQFGRTEKAYLPYPTTQRTGNIIANPLSQQQSYYQTNYGDTYAYGQTVFDDSPLNRTIEASSPGNDWRIIPGSNNDHTIKRAYATNTSIQEIVRFKIDDSGSSPVVNKTAYATKMLFKNVVKNANWQPSDGSLNTIESYTDKNGRTIARVVFEDVSGTVEKRVTQNVYDKQGRLRYILPPKALIGVTTSSGTYTIDDDLVYQYEYDAYNRQIAQRVPGRDWEYLVYDQLDRPILTQDANLADDDQWLFTKYDAFGRPIYSGIYSSTKSRDQLQTDVDNHINGNINNKSNVENRTIGTTTVGGIAMNYTNDAFPVSGIAEVLSVNYYDNYSFTDSDKPTTPSSIQGQTVTSRTQGLQTANFSKTIGQSSWTKLYTYYDETGREIKIYNKNHLGGYTTTDSKLDFRGKTDLAVTKHKRTSGSTELTINDRFTYDYAERSLGHFQKIDSQVEERISENEYDESGFLVKKKVGGSSASSTALQEMVYDYNIRGQLKMLNDVNTLGSKLFAYKINYNTAAEGSSSAPARYDGSISQTIWQSAHDNTKRGYAYLYDELNRLTESKYQFNGSLNGNTGSHFNTQYAYDTQGNISTLTRRNNTGSVIDQLTYNYGSSNGNQLMYVSDSGTSAGFVDGNTNGNDYAYDSNGNMTMDLNKSIAANGIAYNHLDLVNTVNLSSNKSLAFQYDASGAKLQKKYLNGGTTLNIIDYLGGFQYTDGNLQFFPTPSGYVYKSGSAYKYMYIYADHLGNTRVSYTDTNGNGAIESSEVASNRNYYPFGEVHSGAYTDGLAAVYKYTFQGKEYQDEDGLNWHDFGSRMYDPALGRWMATDPQNQFGSPYLAMGNNPISSIDPDGELAVETAVLIGALIGGTYGGVSAAVNGGSASDIVFGVAGGAFTGAFSAAAGYAIPIPAGGVVGYNSGGLTGAVNGFSASFSGGFLSAAFNGTSSKNALSRGLKNGVIGGIVGGISGAISGDANARNRGLDRATGDSKDLADINPNNISVVDNGMTKRRIGISVEGGSVMLDEQLVNTPGYWEKLPDGVWTETRSTPGMTAAEIWLQERLDAARFLQEAGEVGGWIGYGVTFIHPGVGGAIAKGSGFAESIGTYGELILEHDINGLSDQALHDLKKEFAKKAFKKGIFKTRVEEKLFGEIIDQTIDKTFDEWRNISNRLRMQDIYYKF